MSLATSCMCVTMRPTEAHITVVFASLGIGLVLFLLLVLPDIITRHWLHRECFVTESSVTPTYCCESKCSSCNEVYPYSPLCGSLVERTHLEKNLTQCLAGERKFCADEGQFCDGGYDCCDYGYAIPGDRNSTWICYRSVSHRACRLHCPTCYISRIAYTYEKWCSDGICRNMTVYKEISHGRNREAANKIIADEPLGSRKDCWVNPNDSQQIQFRGGYRWWAITLVSIAWAPAAVIILLYTVLWLLRGCELFIGMYINWRLERALMQPDAGVSERRPILRRWDNTARNSLESSSGSHGSHVPNDPPPKYEEIADH